MIAIIGREWISNFVRACTHILLQVSVVADYTVAKHEPTLRIAIKIIKQINKYKSNHQATASGQNAKTMEAPVMHPFHQQIALAQQLEVYSPPCNAGPF